MKGKVRSLETLLPEECQPACFQAYEDMAIGWCVIIDLCAAGLRKRNVHDLQQLVLIDGLNTLAQQQGFDSRVTV